jgi:hypothetical protein
LQPVARRLEALVAPPGIHPATRFQDFGLH